MPALRTRGREGQHILHKKEEEKEDYSPSSNINIPLVVPFVHSPTLPGDFLLLYQDNGRCRKTPAIFSLLML